MVLQPEILKLLLIAAVSLSNEMKLRIRFPPMSMRLNACRASQPAPGMADHADGRLQLSGISQQKHHHARDSLDDARALAGCGRRCNDLCVVLTTSGQTRRQPYQ